MEQEIIRAPNEQLVDYKKARPYTCLVYPDSAPENWRQIARDLHIPFVVSPLHEADPDEEYQYKPHWHVILYFSGNHAPNQVRQLCKIFGGVCPPDDYKFVIRDLPEECRYLCHIGYPDKPQYDPLSVEVYGPINYLDLIETDQDTANYLIDITMYVLEHGVTSFIKFMAWCSQYKRSWYNTCVKRNTYYVRQIIQSNFEDIRQEL